MRYLPKAAAWAVLSISFISSLSPAATADLPDLQTLQTALGISREVGRVTAAYGAALPNPPEFVLIQDVHRHVQVQSQIASLIVHGYEHWGVKKVFLEGAFTPLDMSVFHRVPKKTQNILIERLVKDGDLSGPELAAIQIMEREWVNPPASPFQLFGMEDPKLYRENVRAYQSVLSQRDRALADLVSVRRLQLSMHLPEHNILDEQLDRVEALLRLKLTPSGYDAYLAAKAAIPSTPALDPAIQAAEAYYRLAQKRSHIFLKQAFSRVPASSTPRILVVGGFHTAMMADLLRQEGHSFVVLSPAGGPAAEDSLYERHMMETANDLAQVPHPVR